MLDGHVDILGVPVFSGDKDAALEMIDRKLVGDGGTEPMVVLTPTTEHVVMAQADDIFCTTFSNSDLNVPDTGGMVWADKVLSRRGGREWQVRSRIPGVDLAERVCAQAAEQRKKVFLLGGRNDVALRAADGLKKQFKGLQVGSSAGADDIAHETEAEAKKVIEQINAFGADVLLVAYGAPWQERWVTQHKEDLRAKVVMVVGGAFDYWAGEVKRAPASWRRVGLEWLWRLLHEPWRWRRQLRLIDFIRLVMRS